MKSMSRIALGAALLAGVGGVAITAPVAAQKKPKEEKAAQLKLSNEARTPAAAAQTALAANDTATAGTAVAQLEGVAKTEDERYIAAALRLQLEAMKLQAARTSNTPVNETVLAAPLDALIANPRTPATDLPRFNFQRGLIAYNAKDSATALTYFQRAQQLGYQDPNLSLQMVKIKMDSGDVAGGTVDLEKAIDAQTAAGTKADESLYRYAIAKTNQKRMGPQTYGWLKRYVAAYPTAKNWRDVIVTYGLQQQGVATLDKPQKVDLYRLMRASKSLADQYDYENYAQWTFDLGLPYETKAVITEGRASGKIPASSPSANELFKAANQSISNEGSLSAIEAKALAGANGRIAANTGDAFLGSGENAKAIALYRAALQKGGIDADTVNTRLGIALANSGDKAGAQAAFQAVKTEPRAGIAGLWLAYLASPPTV